MGNLKTKPRIPQIDTNQNQIRVGSRSSRLHSLSITKLPNYSITNSLLRPHVLPCVDQPRGDLLRQRDHVEWLMLEQAPQDDHLRAQHVAF